VIGPKIVANDDRHGRPKPINEAPRGAIGVKGKIAEDIGVRVLADMLVPRRRKKADDRNDIRLFLFQEMKKRSGLLKFAHGGDVKPDARRVRIPAGQIDAKPIEETSPPLDSFSHFLIEQAGQAKAQVKEGYDHGIVDDEPQDHF